MTNKDGQTKIEVHAEDISEAFMKDSMNSPIEVALNKHPKVRDSIGYEENGQPMVAAIDTRGKIHKHILRGRTPLNSIIEWARFNNTKIPPDKIRTRPFHFLIDLRLMA